MSRTNFFDNFFKLLVLLFWPIVWFKWLFIVNTSISFLLFTIYLILSISYLIPFIYCSFKYRDLESIVFLYRLSTLVSFVLTLASFLLFPKNLFLLSLKMIFIFVYFYISCIKVYRHHMDEGVVGILSALLLATIAILY